MPTHPRPTSRVGRRLVDSFIPAVVLPVAAGTVALMLSLPRWAVMWSVAAAIFFGLKWLTWRQSDRRTAPVMRQIGYLLAWPGMDAGAFLDTQRHPPMPKKSEWVFAAGKLLGGLGILFGWVKFASPSNPYWLGWVGMIGIALVLHFGSFHLSSCAWRAIGVEARPLMDWPMASVRLSDFWGRRWNTAFRDLTFRYLFKPLTRRFGTAGALWVGFLFSGLVHDAVISLPAGGGYGGPTLFFLIQAAGMSIERTRVGRRIGLGSGVRGWVFTIAFLLPPAPLLFHPPFVNRVIVPFMHAIGASP